jgi:hypothetical protein
LTLAAWQLTHNGGRGVVSRPPLSLHFTAFLPRKPLTVAQRVTKLAFSSTATLKK